MQQNTSEEFMQSVIRDGREPVPPTTATVPQTKFSTQHLLYGRYGQYAIDTAYFTDTGLRVMMVASSHGLKIPHEVIRVGRPIDMKVVTWTAERTNNKPALPHWDTGNPNEILVSKKITPANPHPLDYGQVVWRVSGEYIYKLLRPIEEVWPCGTTPAEVDKSSSHNLTAEDFDRSILNASHAPVS